MAPKYSDKAKRTHNVRNLQEKLEIIQLSEQGISVTDIGRKLGIPRSTISTIVKNKAKVLKEIKKATPLHTKVIRKRDSLIGEMEKLLNVWIREEISHSVPLSTALIQSKALSLFNKLKAERGETATEETFMASKGWFDRFRRRSNLHNLTVQGEAASADTAAATEVYPAELDKIFKGQHMNSNISGGSGASENEDLEQQQSEDVPKNVSTLSQFFWSHDPSNYQRTDPSSSQVTCCVNCEELKREMIEMRQAMAQLFSEMKDLKAEVKILASRGEGIQQTESFMKVNPCGSPHIRDSSTLSRSQADSADLKPLSNEIKLEPCLYTDDAAEDGECSSDPTEENGDQDNSKDGEEYF